MSFLPLFFYSVALLAAAVGVVALLKEQGTSGRLTFALGMFLLAAELVLTPLAFLAPEEGAAMSWKRWSYLPTALIPFVWLLFSLQFSRGNRDVFLRLWMVPLAIVLLVPLGASLLFPDSMIAEVSRAESGWRFSLGLGGYAACLVQLAAAALLLINLERTFRAAVGTYRWRIKYIILGVAVLFVARVYIASQCLLLSGWELPLEIVRASAVLCAVLLFARGLIRAGTFQVQVYPSERVLQFSVATLLLGVYLIVLGVLSKLAAPWAGAEAMTLKALFLLLSMAGVALLLLSDRARDSVHRYISRHFHRPIHNYRNIWLAYTEKTAVMLNPDDLCRSVANWISETLRVLSVTMWLTDEESQHLRLMASTCVSDGDSSGIPSFQDQDAVVIIRDLQNLTYPFDIDAEKHPVAEKLRRSFPSCFRHGGNRVCVPLHANGRLLGMLTLADRVNSIPLGEQDFELLKCIADQVASNLLNISLSQRLLQAKEMETFQTIAAFFVHDLKNTGSTLNLTLQNLPKHWDNPEFRQDALRAITKSVNHINELIKRLTLFRQKLELHAVPTDINSVIESTVKSLGDPSGVSQSLGPVKVISADPEQLHKVFTNLLLNAREAANGKPQIQVQTIEQDGWVIASVSDNGCGMSPEFISRNLFRPFQSTKKGGIGIGMFQTRAIIEAHGGRIEVESELNRGTTFRVLLPRAKAMPSVESTPARRDLLAA